MISRFLKVGFLFLCAAALFIVLTTFSGIVTLEVNNKTVEMPFSYFVMGGLCFVFGILLLHNVWKLIWSVPKRYQLYLKKKRNQKAQNLVLEGLTSIAAWQPAEAQVATEQAQSLDPNNSLILFVAAQAAHMANDSEKAKTFFHKMLSDQRLRFLGLRGLALEAKKAKDFLKVNEFLKKALEIRHDSPWVLDELMDSNIRLLDLGYNLPLEKTKIAKLVNKSLWSKHVSLYHAMIAEKQLDHLDEEGAKANLKKALNEQPAFIWAALKLASIYKKEHPTKGLKILMRCAQENPHPEVLQLIVSLSKYKTPTEAYQYLSNELNPDKYEVCFFLSDLAAKALLWGEALKWIELAMKIHPTQKAKNLLQTILKATNVDIHPLQVVPLKPDFAWVCKSCNHTFDQWTPICDACEAVDKIHYSEATLAKKQDSVSLLSGI